MEQVKTPEEETPALGERIIISTYVTKCANPTCKKQIEFDTTLPSGWNLKEIKTSIVCSECASAKPARIRHGRQTRTRRTVGQEARPRGHRRRDLLLPVNGLTIPRLVDTIEEFLPWDGDEDLENALEDLAEAVHGPPTEPPQPEPEPVKPVEPEISPMQAAAERQRLRHRQEPTPQAPKQGIGEHLPTWEPLEEEEKEEETEITNPNYPPSSPPVRPIPKSESEEPSRIRKRRRAVSLVAEQRGIEAAEAEATNVHPSTINCKFCEARQLPDVETCTNCARDVHTGKLPETGEVKEDNETNDAPKPDLSSRAIKKMKKDEAIKTCRTLGLGTDGNVKDLKTRLTAYRNSLKEE
jgi:hypothetical protein